MKKLFHLVIFFTIACEVYTQTNDVSEVYYNFLNENQDLNFSASSALFPLQGKYYQAIPDLEYLDSF
ncbi:MAG: hypothetical protein WD512_17575, partial [Candidatus Paceibacterota bacterium]